MMNVGDVMSKRVVTLTEGRTVQDAARAMQKNGIGSVVVLRAGKVSGIVTERDVVAIVGRGLRPNRVRLRDVMTRPVIIGDETIAMQDAVKLMVLHNIKKLPILRRGRLVGIVTLTDFARTEPLFHDLFEKALQEAAKQPKPKTPPGAGRVKEPPSGMYA